MKSFSKTFHEEAKAFIAQLKEKGFEDDFVQSYPLIKKREHFNSEGKKFDIPDGQPHHQATFVTKKSKASSTERNKARWLEIKQNGIAFNLSKQERSNQIKVFMSECARFDIGNHLPKGRMISDKGEMTYASKFIENESDFHDYFFYTLGPYLRQNRSGGYDFVGNPFIEGIGRAIFFYYFYRDDDVSFSNGLILNTNGKKVFIPFDYDRTLWPVTHQHFTVLHPEKRFNFCPNRPQARHIEFQIHHEVVDFWVVPGCSWGQNGIFKLEDYEQLPLIKYHFTLNWQFQEHDTQYHACALSSHQTFLNEKHFATIKFFSTIILKFYLIEKTIIDEQLRKEVIDYFNSAADEMLNEIKDSQKLQQYVLTFKNEIIKAILHEVVQFFLGNKHYLGKTIQEQTVFCTSACSLVLNHFSNVMEILKFKPLTKEEIEKNTSFTINLAWGKEECLQEVKAFYLSQGFTFYADLITTSAKKVSTMKLFQGVPQNTSAQTSAASAAVVDKSLVLLNKPGT